MSIKHTDAESAANATAPRVALADIEAAIAKRYDFIADKAIYAMQYQESAKEEARPDALKLLSICILVMKNSFVVIGKSAPASPENFNGELGKKFAYEDAVRQLWPLMGYALRDKLTFG